jgi:hypothetical protein
MTSLLSLWRLFSFQAVHLFSILVTPTVEGRLIGGGPDCAAVIALSVFVVAVCGLSWIVFNQLRPRE